MIVLRATHEAEVEKLRSGLAVKSDKLKSLTRTLERAHEKSEWEIKNLRRQIAELEQDRDRVERILARRVVVKAYRAGEFLTRFSTDAEGCGYKAGAVAEAPTGSPAVIGWHPGDVQLSHGGAVDRIEIHVEEGATDEDSASE